VTRAPALFAPEAASGADADGDGDDADAAVNDADADADADGFHDGEEGADGVHLRCLRALPARAAADARARLRSTARDRELLQIRVSALEDLVRAQIIQVQ
jgi:hypothetical protein